MKPVPAANRALEWRPEYDGIPLRGTAVEGRFDPGKRHLIFQTQDSGKDKDHVLLWKTDDQWSTGLFVGRKTFFDTLCRSA